MTNYVRYLSRPKAQSLRQIKWTRYFPKPLITALKKVGSDQFILGPVYRNGNVQLGVTGSAHKDDSYLSTAFRELGEEIGLVPKAASSLQLTYSGNFPTCIGREKFIKVYLTRLSELEPVAEKDHNSAVEAKDDRTKKVGCIVAGTRSQVLAFLNKENIFRFFSTDDIVGIAAVSCKSAREFVAKL